MITKEELIQKEIIHCVSSLVFEIGQQNINKWYHLFSKDDWETPTRNYLFHEMTEDDLRSFLDDKDEHHDHIKNLSSLRKIAWILIEPEEYQDFCGEHGLDPEISEVYEHWIVSNWLANRLKTQEEIIERDFYGLTICARQTPVQSIAMDGVIDHIHQEIIQTETNNN